MAELVKTDNRHVFSLDISPCSPLALTTNSPSASLLEFTVLVAVQCISLSRGIKKSTACSNNGAEKP